MKFLTVLFCLTLFFNSTYAQDLKQEKKIKNLSDLALLKVEDDNLDPLLAEQLKSRKTYLKWHKYSGWASVALMLAVLASAPEDKTSDLHKWAGIAAAGMYTTSAGLAYWAPRPKGIKDKKNIAWHKRLAWVHAPAFVLTLLTGFVAHNENKKKKKKSLLGKSHKGVSALTTIPLAISAAITLYEF